MVDPLPAFRAGLAGALAASTFSPDEISEVLVWARRDGPAILFLTVTTPPDWREVGQLGHFNPALAVIAVLDDPSVSGEVRALREGAVGCVARGADVEQFWQIVALAQCNQTRLPLEVVRVLSSPSRMETVEHLVSSRDVEWLRLLAGGETIGQLAKEVGYSERMMFRRLRDLYDRINVRNRTEAVLLAQERRWI